MGDRIQFTAPANDLKVANRELGTVEAIEQDGQMRLKMDGGRDVQLDPREHPHLDHGYAVTSHSSQGQTADRVLDSRRYRAGRERPAQQPHGLRCHLARRRGRAAFHERPREAARGARPRCFPPERPCDGEHTRAVHRSATGSLSGSTAGPRHRSAESVFRTPACPDRHES